MNLAISLIFSVSEANSLRFVEITNSIIKTSSPPQVVVYYDRKCDEKFFKLIKEEVKSDATQADSIAIGLLLEKDLNIKCKGNLISDSVNLGDIFQSKTYKVVKIKIK